jgi:hypothetical protein
MRGARAVRIGTEDIASLTSGSADMSAMSSLLNFTDSASGRSRLPRHTGQSTLTMYCAARFFIIGLSVVANVV